MKRGQVSVEFSLAFLALFFFFFFLINVSFFRSSLFEDWSSGFSNNQKCVRIARILNSVYGSGPGTDWNGFFDGNVIVLSDSYVVFGDVNFSAELLDDENVGDFNGLAAYYSCGSEERMLLPFMQMYGVDVYYSGSCSSVSDSNLNLLISRLDQYDVVFLENPLLNYNSYRNAFDSWVASGGTLVVTEYLYNRYWGIIMTNFWWRGHWTDQNTYVVGSHPSYPFVPGQTIFFHKCPAIFWNVNRVSNYSFFNLPALSYFSYGSGELIFFPDLNAVVFGTDWNFPKVVASIVKPDVLLDDSVVFCEHQAIVVPARLNMDEVSVRNVGGIVVVENK